MRLPSVDSTLAQDGFQSVSAFNIFETGLTDSLLSGTGRQSLGSNGSGICEIPLYSLCELHSYSDEFDYCDPSLSCFGMVHRNITDPTFRWDGWDNILPRGVLTLYYWRPSFPHFTGWVFPFGSDVFLRGIMMLYVWVTPSFWRRLEGMYQWQMLWLFMSIRLLLGGGFLLMTLTALYCCMLLAGLLLGSRPLWILRVMDAWFCRLGFSIRRFPLRGCFFRWWSSFELTRGWLFWQASTLFLHTWCWKLVCLLASLLSWNGRWYLAFSELSIVFLPLQECDVWLFLQPVGFSTLFVSFLQPLAVFQCFQARAILHRPGGIPRIALGKGGKKATASKQQILQKKPCGMPHTRFSVIPTSMFWPHWQRLSLPLSKAVQTRSAAILVVGLLVFEPNLKLMILTKENVAAQAFAEHIESFGLPDYVTSKIGRLVGYMELRKNKTNKTSLDVTSDNRHEVLRNKRLLIGCGGGFQQECTQSCHLDQRSSPHSHRWEPTVWQHWGNLSNCQNTPHMSHCVGRRSPSDTGWFEKKLEKADSLVRSSCSVPSPYVVARVTFNHMSFIQWFCNILTDLLTHHPTLCIYYWPILLCPRSLSALLQLRSCGASSLARRMFGWTLPFVLHPLPFFGLPHVVKAFLPQ